MATFPQSSRARVCILAGGLGMRMRPRTLDLPKVLLPVAGRPFARHLLARLQQSGFERVVLSIDHLGDAVERELGAEACGVRIDYVRDGARPLGTGGALKRALSALSDPFLVTYGDSYLPFDYAAPLLDLEAHPEALGTMSVFENDGRFDASNTQISGDQVSRYEKGGAAGDSSLRFIDYGALALRHAAFSTLPDGPSGLHFLQGDLARRGVLRAFVVRERFYEIGSEAGLADLEAHLAASASQGEFTT